MVKTFCAHCLYANDNCAMTWLQFGSILVLVVKDNLSDIQNIDLKVQPPEFFEYLSQRLR